MKKISAALFVLVAIVSGAHAWTHGGTTSSGLPVLVAGTLAPASQTPFQPSASTWGPSCLDASWGPGCNVPTHLCIAPTSGTPLESCQAPQEFVVTGGTGNGTNSTIFYTSYAHYTYPNATPLIISGATQANWNTPAIGVNSESAGGTSPNFTETLGLTAIAPATSFPPPPNGQTMYVGEVTSSATPQGLNTFGWSTYINFSGSNVSGPVLGLGTVVPGSGGTPGTYSGFAFPAVGACTGVTANITVNGSGVVPPTGVTLVSAGAGCAIGTSLSGAPGGISGFSVPVASVIAQNFYHVPLTGGSGTGGTVNITSGGVGTVLNVTADIRGTGYINGDVVGINPAGFQGLTTMTGFTATVNFITPNGVWSVQSSTSSSVTYGTGATEVVGALAGLNSLGYNGTVQAPWIVSSSTCNIGGVPEHCSVTFPNPNSCASSCVSGATQIAAGQNDNVIMNWHYGEDVQNSLQNGDVRACVMAKHISGIQFVVASLDGGPWSTVTAPIVSPWGAGKSTLAEPTTPYSYCFHFAASAVADSLHEIRAIAYPVTGYAGFLSSVQSVDGTASSTSFTAHNHALQSMKLVGVTNSFDNRFQNFDWRGYTAGITATSGTASGGGASGDTFTLGFTQPANFPVFQAHQTINIAGVVANESCAIQTGSYADGAHLNLALASGCNFPTGAEVNIAGVSVGSATILSGTYTSGTGVISLAFSAPPFGASPTTGVGGVPYVNQYNLTLTGSGAGLPSLQGTHTLLSSSSGGTVLNFQDSTGLTATISGGTVAGNTLSFNTGAPATVSTGGTTTISIPSISTGVWASGGTVTANWNGNCVVVSASSGSVTCPQPFNTATARTSGGTITAQGNLFCVVGGAGDWPAPYDPAFLSVPEYQMTPETVILQPYSATNCTGNGDGTGCSAICGTTPSQSETLWLTRHNSGVDERRPFGAGVINENVNGSLWITTNAGGTIKAQNAYTNPWQQTAGGTACLGSVVAAGAPLTAYTGNYCTDLSHAFFGLVPTENGITQALTQSGGCLVFTKAGNGSGAVPFYANEPVIVTAYDTNTTPALSNWSVYWTLPLSGDSITLATTPGGPCINETPSLIFGGTSVAASQALLFKDEGMDSLLVACDTTNNASQQPCSSANPETITNKSTIASGLPGATYYARSGYLSIAPDTAAGSTFPATSHEISLSFGAANWFSKNIGQGGRIRVAVDSIQKPLQLSTVFPVTKTPPITAVTGGSLSGTTVTLNFAALPSGVAWQVPTAGGSQGQGIIVSGVTPADWNCGTATAPCRVLTAPSSTQITYSNPSATTPTWSSGGKIVPATIVLEFPQGTFAYDSVNNPRGLCAVSNVSFNTGSAKACVTAYQNGAVATVAGTNSTAWPFQYIPGADVSNPLFSNNCLPVGGAQSAQGALALRVFNGGLMPVVPGIPGSTNDIMELTWDGVAGQTFSFNAFNDCAGPWTFASSAFNMEGLPSSTTTDVWADGRDVIGPSWNVLSAINNDVYAASTGANFMTNGLRSNVVAPADTSSYAWGINVENIFGSCANASVVLVDIRCVGGEHAVPLSLGGGNQTGARGGPFWLPILGGLHGGASGTPTTCGGLPCTNSTTDTVQVAQGTLPGTLTPGWLAYVICNFSSPLNTLVATTNVNAVNVTAYNNATSPSTVTLNLSGMGSNCLTGTQNPVIIFYNITHVDMLFWSANQSQAPLTSGFPWLTVDHVIYENLQCQGCVQMQGIFMAGYQYTDDDFDDDDIEVMNIPSFLTIHAIDYGGSGSTTNAPYGGGQHYNFMVRNTNLFGASVGVSDSDEIIFQDVYHINDYAGTWIGFPFIGQGNALFGGTLGLSGAQNNPASNAPSVNGSYQNMTVWPSQGIGVDSSGNMVTPSNPWSGSMSACPWRCTTGDSGLGSM